MYVHSHRCSFKPPPKAVPRLCQEKQILIVYNPTLSSTWCTDTAYFVCCIFVLFDLHGNLPVGLRLNRHRNRLGLTFAPYSRWVELLALAINLMGCGALLLSRNIQVTILCMSVSRWTLATRPKLVGWVCIVCANICHFRQFGIVVRNCRLQLRDFIMQQNNWLPKVR